MNVWVVPSKKYCMENITNECMDNTKKCYIYMEYITN